MNGLWGAAAGLVLAALTSGAGVAYADDPPAPPPSVAADDLPPLPAAADDLSSSATVLAATSAEEDVVVGAAKREQSLGNVASAVTVITADRIRRFGYRTIGEAVAGVAGAYVEDTRITANLGFRGINILGDFNTRILVLIDGVTVNEAWGASAGLGFGSLVSIDDVARIEVIRGPVSSVYGANAFFGIINIVTRNATETPRAWARTSINSIAGSVTSAGFAVGNVKEQLRGTAQVSDRIGETLSLDGVGDNLKGDGSYSYAASLAGSYNGTFGQIRAYRYRRDNPFAPYNSDPAAPSPYNQYNSEVEAEIGHTATINDRFTLVGRAYGNAYEFYDNIDQYQLPVFKDYGDATTVGAEIRGRYDVLPSVLGITAGTEANYDITKSHSFTVGTDGVTVPKDFNIEGVYAEADGQPTSWLGYTAGLRYDRNSVIDTRASPRAALFLSKPEQYGLKLLYAQGFRNPSAYESFFYDNVTFAPANHLHSETISSYEAVLWAKPIAGLSTRLSAYYWDARGIVEELPLVNPPVGEENLIQFQNVGRIVTEGLEAEVSYRNSAGWYGFAGGDYSRVGSSDTGGDVAFGHVVNAPAWTVAGGVSTPKLWSVFHLSAELEGIASRATRDQLDGTASPDSPAWFGLNLTAYAPAIHGFDFTAGVRNLIGTRDLMPAWPDFDRDVPTAEVVARVPGEGREFFGKVGYSF